MQIPAILEDNDIKPVSGRAKLIDEKASKVKETQLAKLSLEDSSMEAYVARISIKLRYFYNSILVDFTNYDLKPLRGFKDIEVFLSDPSALIKKPVKDSIKQVSSICKTLDKAQKQIQKAKKLSDDMSEFDYSKTMEGLSDIEITSVKQPSAEKKLTKDVKQQEKVNKTEHVKSTQTKEKEDNKLKKASKKQSSTVGHTDDSSM